MHTVLGTPTGGVCALANVHDVAAYILEKQPGMTTWKLQKLVYYSQAWHLAWEEEPLFAEPIEAWANGPVVRELFKHHKGRFVVNAWQWGDPAKLTQPERETVDAVLTSYGALTGRQLSILTHEEAPWADARAGLSSTARSDCVIEAEALQAFYSALDASVTATPVEALAWDRPDV